MPYRNHMLLLGPKFSLSVLACVLSFWCGTVRAGEWQPGSIIREGNLFHAFAPEQYNHELLAHLRRLQAQQTGRKRLPIFAVHGTQNGILTPFSDFSPGTLGHAALMHATGGNLTPANMLGAVNNTHRLIFDRFSIEIQNFSRRGCRNALFIICHGGGDVVPLLLEGTSMVGLGATSAIGLDVVDIPSYGDTILFSSNSVEGELMHMNEFGLFSSSGRVGDHLEFGQILRESVPKANLGLVGVEDNKVSLQMIPPRGKPFPDTAELIITATPPSAGMNSSSANLVASSSGTGVVVDSPSRVPSFRRHGRGFIVNSFGVADVALLIASRDDSFVRIVDRISALALNNDPDSIEFWSPLSDNFRVSIHRPAHAASALSMLPTRVLDKAEKVRFVGSPFGWLRRQYNAICSGMSDHLPRWDSGYMQTTSGCGSSVFQR